MIFVLGVKFCGFLQRGEGDSVDFEKGVEFCRFVKCLGSLQKGCYSGDFCKRGSDSCGLRKRGQILLVFAKAGGPLGFL